MTQRFDSESLSMKAFVLISKARKAGPSSAGAGKPRKLSMKRAQARRAGRIFERSVVSPFQGFSRSLRAVRWLAPPADVVSVLRPCAQNAHPSIWVAATAHTTRSPQPPSTHRDHAHLLIDHHRLQQVLEVGQTDAVEQHRGQMSEVEPGLHTIRPRQLRQTHGIRVAR